MIEQTATLYAPLDDGDFVPPVSVEEAMEHMLVLKEEITDISVQLSSRDRRGENGQRMSDREFWDWRHRALVAQKYKIERLRHLKAWLHVHRTAPRPVSERTSTFATDVADDPVELLSLAYKVVRRCVNDEEIVLTRREQETFEVIKAFLKQHRTPKARASDPKA